MRRIQPILLSVIAACVLAFAGTPAGAQEPVVQMKADIPFAFYVGGEKMPPGTYRVETVPDTRNSLVLSVERAEPKQGESHFAAVRTVPADTSEIDDGPRLVFEQVGDLNLLVKVVPRQGMVREVDR